MDPTTPEERRPLRRGSGRPGRERGAILVLTAVSMVALLSMVAYAVDIGMRNQQLARDQHAVDAAVLASTYDVTVNGNDAHAADLAMRMIEQNTGLPLSAWAGCVDPAHLARTVPGTGCISFDVDAQGNQVVRIVLPAHHMNSIFGGIAGVTETNLTAVAGADGNLTCAANDPNCNAAATSTTAPATTTTTQFDYDDWCNNQLDQASALTWAWYACHDHRTEDRDSWLVDWCSEGQKTVLAPGNQSTWSWFVSWHDLYIWYSSYCEPVMGQGWSNDRQTWLQNWCPQQTEQTIYTDWSVYAACHPLIGGDDWGQWYSTSTTSSTSSTTTVPPASTTTPQTTAPPSSAPPTTIDLSI